MAPLLSSGVRHGHEAFGEEAAALALGPEGSLSPEDERPDLLLRMIVGGWDAIAVDKRPQSCGMGQNICAGTGDVTELGVEGALERGLDLLPHGHHEADPISDNLLGGRVKTFESQARRACEPFPAIADFGMVVN